MKSRKLAKVAAVIGVSVLVIVALAAVITQTATFHRFLLATVIRKAEAATGGRVEIGGLAFSWRGLRVDFYNVVLHGTELPAERPLLAADHLAVGVKILSVWKRQVDLNEILLDHPVLSLQIDLAGRNNFPVAPSSTGETNSNNNIFDLAIQHVRVQSGDIYYNDRKIPLSADVRDFHAESSFSRLAQQYKLSAAYDQGVLTYQNLKPIPHTLSVRLTATRSGVTVDQIVASTNKSNITMSGQLNDYANPSLNGVYVTKVDTADVAGILATAARPAGQFQIRGNISYKPAGHNSFIDGLDADGVLDSASLRVRTSSANGELRAIHAPYRLVNGTVYVRGAQAQTLGGRLTANYQVAHLDTTPQSRLDASAQGIAMRSVAEAFLVKGMPEIAMSAKANVKVQATWGENIQRGSARANAVISTDDTRHSKTEIGRAHV